MATTTNLSSLVINYLTQAQYDAAAEGGTLNENQLYLTPAAQEVHSVSLSSSTENIDNYNGRRTGNVVQLTFDALNIPPSTWTNIAVVSKAPLYVANAVVATSTVNEYGKCDVQSNGTIRVYHTNASTSSFYGISITYVCSAD